MDTYPVNFDSRRNSKPVPDSPENAQRKNYKSHQRKLPCEIYDVRCFPKHIETYCIEFGYVKGVCLFHACTPYLGLVFILFLSTPSLPFYSQPPTCLNI